MTALDLDRAPTVATAGVPLFADELAAQAVATVRVDWAPPAAGAEAALKRAVLAPGTAAATAESARRLTTARAQWVDVRPAAEVLGLAKPGEGHTLFDPGKSNPGGSFPINTNGGGLSFNHSGMYGMQLLIESYRQLSGTAEDGVNGLPGKQTNAKSLVVNGTGGSLSATGTLVLTADE